MDTINLVFKPVNNLKYYLEIDGVMVFPEKHQSKYKLVPLAPSEDKRRSWPTNSHRNSGVWRKSISVYFRC